jgi:hypothetical protein
MRMLRACVSSVSGVSDVCFKCSIWMLQMLHNMPVANVCLQVFHAYVQVFYLDVVKVDLDIVYVCNGLFQVFFRCF